MESKSRERFESFGDDDRTILVSSPLPVVSPENKRQSIDQRPFSNRLSIDLNLSHAESKQSARYDQFADTSAQEKTILVVFDLPDGSQGEGCFKLGQTVEVLKSFIQNEFGIPMGKQILYLEEKVMMDPLSLLDYPESKGEDEIFVRVEGPLPKDYKK